MPKVNQKINLPATASVLLLQCDQAEYAICESMSFRESLADALGCAAFHDGYASGCWPASLPLPSLPAVNSNKVIISYPARESAHDVQHVLGYQ